MKETMTLLAGDESLRAPAERVERPLRDPGLRRHRLRARAGEHEVDIG